MLEISGDGHLIIIFFNVVLFLICVLFLVLFFILVYILDYQITLLAVSGEGSGSH